MLICCNFLLLSMLNGCAAQFLWKLWCIFFRILWIESSKEQHLFEIIIVWIIINLFTVTFATLYLCYKIILSPFILNFLAYASSFLIYLKYFEEVCKLHSKRKQKSLLNLSSSWWNVVFTMYLSAQPYRWTLILKDEHCSS